MSYIPVTEIISGSRLKDYLFKKADLDEGMEPDWENLAQCALQDQDLKNSMIALGKGENGCFLPVIPQVHANQ